MEARRLEASGITATAEGLSARTLDRYELSRYLDDCSEMLSVTTKLAALYAQESDDTLVLGAVREIEGMAGNLSSNIWQKIMIIDVLDDA